MRRCRNVACCVIVLSSLALPACDNPTPTQPTLPYTATTAPSASTPAPSAPTPDGFSLSGVVFENASGSSRSVAGGRVFFSVDSRPGGQVQVDTRGRYTIPGLFAGRLVRVTWFPSMGMNELPLHQPCPANTTIAGDAELNIEVVRLGSREFIYRSPTLSGVVFETTPQGRRPLGATRVLYSLKNWGGFDAYTETDPDGRYQFCGIPKGVGAIGAGDCNDAVLELPVDVNGDTVLDVDLASFNASCP